MNNPCAELVQRPELLELNIKAKREQQQLPTYSKAYWVDLADKFAAADMTFMAMKCKEMAMDAYD